MFGFLRHYRVRFRLSQVTFASPTYKSVFAHSLIPQRNAGIWVRATGRHTNGCNANISVCTCFRKRSKRISTLERSMIVVDHADVRSLADRGGGPPSIMVYLNSFIFLYMLISDIPRRVFSGELHMLRFRREFCPRIDVTTEKKTPDVLRPLSCQMESLKRRACAAWKATTRRQLKVDKATCCNL